MSLWFDYFFSTASSHVEGKTLLRHVRAVALSLLRLGLGEKLMEITLHLTNNLIQHGGFFLVLLKYTLSLN